jgi:hypothetical protein
MNSTQAALTLQADKLAYFHRLLTFGDAVVDGSMAAASRGAAGDTLLDDADDALIEMANFGDACALMAERVPGYDYDGCAELGGGIMTHGLHGTVREFIRRAKALAARRSVAVVDNATSGVGYMTMSGVTSVYSIPDELASEDMQFLHDAADVYMTPAFDEIARIFAVHVEGVVANQQVLLQAFVPLFLLAFMAFMALWFIPALHRTNADIIAQRSLLLLLPNQVVASCAPVRELIEDILGGAGAGGGAGTGGGGGGGIVTGAGAKVGPAGGGAARRASSAM